MTEIEKQIIEAIRLPDNEWYCIEGHMATGTKFYKETGGYYQIDINLSAFYPSFPSYVPLRKFGPKCRMHEDGINPYWMAQ